MSTENTDQQLKEAEARLREAKARKREESGTPWYKGSGGVMVALAAVLLLGAVYLRFGGYGDRELGTASASASSPELSSLLDRIEQMDKERKASEAQAKQDFDKAKAELEEQNRKALADRDAEIKIQAEEAKKAREQVLAAEKAREEEVAKAKTEAAEALKAEMDKVASQQRTQRVSIRTEQETDSDVIGGAVTEEDGHLKFNPNTKVNVPVVTSVEPQSSPNGTYFFLKNSEGRIVMVKEDHTGSLSDIKFVCKRPPGKLMVMTSLPPQMRVNPGYRPVVIVAQK